LARRNIRATLAYDGTDFWGWQIQASGRTVQGVLEAALERMHRHPVRVRAAGRTDAGVHAAGQVISFFTDLDSIPAEKYRDALNSYLPPDIRVISSREAGPDFHARRSARVRVYGYYLYVAEVGLPQYRRYCWRIRQRPSLEVFNRMAARLVGEHDFSTFAAAGSAESCHVRQVYTACFYLQGPFIVFRIAANSFLWKMVRSIVGTIVELEQGEEGEERLGRILQARDRSLAGNTAPARGLFLERVLYDGETL
jgi:tRNA pseudouridine38-40 synthase